MKITLEIMENKQSEVLHDKRTQALETWAKTTNTKLIQVNGQRIYGGPPEVWDGPVPGAHCEVFISQIPRDAYEDQLIPLFSSVGPLWKFRLMMNFSGENRGFAYAKYGSPAVAAEAVRLLHGHMLEPGFFLKVSHSTEKRHLCIGHLPNATRQEGLLQVLRTLADGVEDVSLTSGPDEVSATVAFSSHYAASMAKKMLVEAFNKLFALTVSVQWQSTVRPQELSLPQRHILNSPQLRMEALCPRTPPRAPGFCRAVGGPATSHHSQHPCTTGLFSSSSPVMLLRHACKASGFGQPLYDMNYSHTGPDGSIYLTYSVRIPGVTMPFTGLVSVMRGLSVTSMLKKAQHAAAQQVLLNLTSSATDKLTRERQAFSCHTVSVHN